MQIRRLVKTGSASYTISLPKDWVERNKLKKGDILFVKENSAGEVIVTHKEKQDEQEIKEITIEIDNKDIGTIRRETISAYINNYHLFNFIGKTLNEKLPEVRKILDNFLALEIQEQTTTKLSAKDFLNLDEFSVNNTIRRMDMLNRSMLLDCKKVFKGEKISESLRYRDFELDKLFFLMSRLIRSALSNQQKAKAFKITNVEALSLWNIAKNIERVADSTKNLAKVLEEHDKKDIRNFENMFASLGDYYLKTIKAFFTNDRKLADRVIAEKEDIEKEIDALKVTAKNYKVIDNLRQLATNIRNIGKIVLDFE
ncbi:hypothetical protein DRJ17_01525 [Candidatus Woesearchaeota archaeon]|nr:MAG: hypothetical protein DRJ17_01525 [Candidatus Woesearchaeota archaeon]